MQLCTNERFVFVTAVIRILATYPTFCKFYKRKNITKMTDDVTKHTQKVNIIFISMH